MRKITILIVCMAVVLLASLAVVSAEMDDHESFGVSYNAPEGYTFDGAYMVINAIPNCTYAKEGAVYKYLSGSDEVSVTIFNLNSSSSTIDDVMKDNHLASDEAKTIAGIDGYIFDGTSSVTFNYVQNGKFIYIKAPDESIIEQMLSWMELFLTKSIILAVAVS